MATFRFDGIAIVFFDISSRNEVTAENYIFWFKN